MHKALAEINRINLFRTRNGRKMLNKPPRKEKKSVKDPSSKEGDNGGGSDSDDSSPSSSVGNSRCGSPVAASSDGNRKRGAR